MKWSWKIARVAGIDVYIHATFLILLAWLAMSYWNQSGSAIAVARGLGFVLALFACVILHEYGHALTARRYGIHTRNITLLPIGGVAALEGMPKDPRQEIKIALAGPLVNFVIAGVLWILVGNETEAPLGLTQGSFLHWLMAVNFILAVFNLLPAFPMDGGRVLRAALALRMSSAQATRVAANVGQVMALGFGWLGLVYNPFLLFIALFVWIGAAAEASAERMKSALSGATAGHAMLTEYHTLSAEQSLKTAVDLTLKSNQKDFPVVKDGQFTGVLTQSLLLKGLEDGGEETPVGSLALDEAARADIHESLDALLARMQGNHIRLVAVQDGGHTVGIVDLDNIMELIRIHTAIEGHRS